MKYAVISIRSKQYLVGEGDEVLVEGRELIQKPDVLMYSDSENVLVGSPYLDGVSVDVDHLGEVKGDKVKVLKYKAKSRYRKRFGARGIFSKIKIKKISLKSS
jgi:large subunit ribosomal protein L21